MSDGQMNPIIEMNEITKAFSGVYALSGITFDVCPGEIHCIVGENGAGKSTLMKILSGAYTPTSGTIQVDGETYNSLTPAESQKQGINIVYQENDLVPSMDVVENIFVGNEKTKAFAFIDYKAMKKETLRLMDEFGIALDTGCKIEDMSVSDQQFVKILKALSSKPRILILDEPTSMFNVEDAGIVLDLCQKIAARGIAIIYISHFLAEIVQIADRITVIRDGSVVRIYDNSRRDISVANLTRDMVGRPLDLFYKKETHDIGDVVLEVQDLKVDKHSPSVSFELRRGEILGFAGMVGSGRTEIMRALVGADKRYSGDILLDGKKIRINTPEDSIKHGFAFITEDRQRLGLMLGQSVLENSTILGYKEKIKGLFINIKKHPSLVEPLLEELKVKAPSIWSEVIYLSGGNQQKVVLAKWLFTEKSIYIFDEPTRGIDVNAKQEFYRYMSELTKAGKSILMISSDMPELISMSDRVLVIRGGAIDCELVGDRITEEEIIKEALGVK